MWAEWSYNTSVHSTTGVSSLEVTFGRKSSSIPQYLSRSSPVVTVDDMLIDREAIFVKLWKKLLKVQAQMMTIADNHRRDVNFEPRQWVMVKLGPYCQLSATRTSYLKLAKRLYGPFKILSRIGKVAYKLQLSEVHEFILFFTVLYSNHFIKLLRTRMGL